MGGSRGSAIVDSIPKRKGSRSGSVQSSSSSGLVLAIERFSCLVQSTTACSTREGSLDVSLDLLEGRWWETIPALMPALPLDFGLLNILACRSARILAFVCSDDSVGVAVGVEADEKLRPGDCGGREAGGGGAGATLASVSEALPSSEGRLYARVV